MLMMGLKEEEITLDVEVGTDATTVYILKEIKVIC